MSARADTFKPSIVPESSLQLQISLFERGRACHIQFPVFSIRNRIFSIMIIIFSIRIVIGGLFGAYIIGKADALCINPSSRWTSSWMLVSTVLSGRRGSGMVKVRRTSILPLLLAKGVLGLVSRGSSTLDANVCSFTISGCAFSLYSPDLKARSYT